MVLAAAQSLQSLQLGKGMRNNHLGQVDPGQRDARGRVKGWQQAVSQLLHIRLKLKPITRPSPASQATFSLSKQAACCAPVPAAAGRPCSRGSCPAPAACGLTGSHLQALSSGFHCSSWHVMHSGMQICPCLHCCASLDCLAHDPNRFCARLQSKSPTNCTNGELKYMHALVHVQAEVAAQPGRAEAQHMGLPDQQQRVQRIYQRQGNASL